MPTTIHAAARCEAHALKSAPVVATQGSTVALLPPRGGRSRPGTPRSDVLRNETAIQRVLPMAARHAHEFECGERRRGTSQDGGLRRGAALGTCWPQRQQPPREPRDPARPRTALRAPRRAARRISRRGTRSQRRHGWRIVARRSGAALARLEPRLPQRTSAARRRRSGLAAAQIGSRRGVASSGVVWARYGARSSFLRAGRA